MKLLPGLIILVTFDQLGGWLIRTMDWPIPGSVMGMLMLFTTLLLINKPPQPVVQCAELLLRHLAFFFVPAGVGIVLLFDLIAEEWLAMLVSMVVSTLISLLFTAWIMQLMVKPIVMRNDDEP